MKIIVYVLLVLFIVASCRSNAPVPSVAEEEPTLVAPASGDEPTATAPADENGAPQFVPLDANSASAGNVAREASVEVSGPAEVVFDWTNDRCEDENIPDIAARAFRDAEGRVQLWIGHYYNYRMIGPDLDNVKPDCTASIMRSDFNPDPSKFNDSEWLAAPYTEDGNTIYAIVHNEYRGDTHNAARPNQCIRSAPRTPGTAAR